MSQREFPSGIRSLDAVFRPRSIAVVGASDDPTRINGRPIAFARRFGYEGAIYPINPSRQTVQGLRAYPSLRDAPDGIDCAIIALPAALVIDALHQCAGKGIRAVVLFTSGFAELGEAGQRKQEEITRIARAHGIRLLGPNVIGCFCLSRKTYVTFLSDVDGALPAGKPRIGLVSQSGGYGAHIYKLALQRGLAVDQVVTTGNEADIELGEVMEWMAESPDVDIIVGYIEGIRSKASFIRGLEAAHRKRKPVVLMKVGATQAGAAAAASHTAALAGADAVYDALLREYGAYRARSNEEVLDVVYALSAGKPLRKRKLGVVTISGGAGVQIADFASEAGLDLPMPSEATQRALREIAPFGSPANPVDVTAQISNDPEIFTATLDRLLDAGYDSLLMWLGPAVTNARAGAPIRATIERIAATRPDVLQTINLIGGAEVTSVYEAAGCLLFEEPRRAVQALAALRYFERVFSRPLPVRPDVSQMTLLAPDTTYNEVDAKRVLAGAGVALLDERLVHTPAQAAEAAREIGRPVAVKVVSADIQHKSDVGGVALSLASPEEAAQAVRRMAGEIPRKAPTARIDGYLVSPMLNDGVECIVGVHADPLFGPVVMFGLGGVMVEVMQDVAFALAPLDEAGALELVRRVKGHRLLTGFRGRPPADLPALARAIASISRLAARNADRLQALEVNPLCVLPEGQGVVALDAVVQTGAPGLPIAHPPAKQD
ncbi:Pimeloyl-CoA synthetase [Cupriavidus necator]|uniref:CoA-binding protein n=1 Tax=Cupriavidus necator (strain ATCC 17699 / DSM 428 / KCTC 22496 / NCIMB 10442 / H16 / Stanier 337) TaxID=381666 RepID=Q0K4A4_CUPNH|nr:acetate--CoA ligase family protein [Cupriavidus necator]QCC03097.1 CoA-binding protein [Cupriavidus necator H16]QQB80154.1 acetate--CoA ligase family protein [Cupriavidus necator]WKA44413.1 acetate--CoA ligase family protein [Cupriavidus necator]CAJ95170.1 Pimeloyl-CoA synthetase [Cupriavidus necator H16]